ncbi:Protein trichome birefringence-like 33 [Ananas comosus]|uniref:Protein trichome birefringence-like 33 n=1 Tax=Ananas comosus TaxID=4615 RepID=A0A199UGX0_ANACO|nr:Protein trichome birefringence-like 33 [Ananas comosus]
MEYCNIFEGVWVYDEAARPLYGEEDCPYIYDQLNFDASAVLEMLRGKRMMFVGDSVNHGQFFSMVCLLHRIIPLHAKSFQSNGSLSVFKAKDYNASIEFYWAPFLVESNSDNAVAHRIGERVILPWSIDFHARHWKGSHIIVFNTYLWWMNGASLKILRGEFEGDREVMEMVREDAYELALRSMVEWVEENMDPHNSRVFFTTMSPTHWRSREWGGDPNGNCFNQTTPIEDPTYWGEDSSKSMMRVVAEALSSTTVPITILNITQLSEYRKDAHPQIYKK